MSLKKFFIYSFTLHAFFLSLIMLYIPVNVNKKVDDKIFTRLVSPEELFDERASVPPTPKEKILIAPQRSSIPHTESVKKVLPKSDILRDAGIPEGDDLHRKLAEKKNFKEERIDNEWPPLKHEVSPLKQLPSVRERLFDEGVIGELAKKDTKEEKKEKIFTFDAKEYKFLVYNKKLKERIESIWIYPPEAAARGIYGDLLIKFSIKKNGRLGDVELIRTSGHKTLDDAAIKALKDGEPYWPLPEEWGIDNYTIVGHFIYTIHGYYIR